MFDWFAHRVFTLRSLGRWYGRRGYPRPDTFVALPLYDVTPIAGRPPVAPDGRHTPERDQVVTFRPDTRTSEGAAE